MRALLYLQRFHPYGEGGRVLSEWTYVHEYVEAEEEQLYQDHNLPTIMGNVWLNLTHRVILPTVLREQHNLCNVWGQKTNYNREDMVRHAKWLEGVAAFTLCDVIKLGVRTPQGGLSWTTKMGQWGMMTNTMGYYHV